MRVIEFLTSLRPIHWLDHQDLIATIDRFITRLSSSTMPFGLGISLGLSKNFLTSSSLAICR